jgi:hypothetical protein
MADARDAVLGCDLRQGEPAVVFCRGCLEVAVSLIAKQCLDGEPYANGKGFATDSDL